MSNSSADKLAQLYSEMYVLLRKEAELSRNTDQILEEAKASIDPRKQFNNWLRTADGKNWKEKQFEYQNGKCAYCGESLRFADMVVHHVNPLRDFGTSANKPDNFKLLHPSCNLEIGTKIVSFE